MSSSLTDWLLAFRQLHEKARRGQLREADLLRYRTNRDELARALLAAQRLQLRSGEVPRRALRVPRALQLDLQLRDGPLRALTQDISSGGFSALLAKVPTLGEEIGYSIRLPAAEPLAGRARVHDVKSLQGNARVSFVFVGMSEADKERAELFVFDTVLAQLAAK
jgi:hypothetical protein